MPRHLTLSRRRALLAALALPLAGCTGDPVLPPAATPVPAPAPGVVAGRVFLLTHGWHTDVALPAQEISGPLTLFLQRYPGAQTLVFGYGRRGYMTEAAHTLADLLLGPLPGAGALEVSALHTDPATAYGARHTLAIGLPPGGAARLCAFIWASFTKNAAGEPIAVGHGDFPGSVIFAAVSTYDASHTCNTWSARALADGGLPIRPQGIIFSSQIDHAARRLAARYPGG